MSNVYDIFKSVQNKRKTYYDNRSAAFILEGKLSQDIIHKRLNKTIKSALVFDSKEGPDEVIVYSLLSDDLLKADYFVFDNVNYLVYENIKLTDKDVNYKKQKAVECNVSFTHNNVNYIAYFTTRVRNTTDVPVLSGKEVLQPNEKPLIILPTSNALDIGENVVIGGKPWKINGYDNITNQSITYLYLERGYEPTVGAIPEKEESITIIENEALVDQGAAQVGPESTISLRPMVEYTFTTEGAYFSSTPRVEVISRSLSQVKFKVPYGIEEVTISTKSSGLIEETTYKVVL